MSGPPTLAAENRSAELAGIVEQLAARIQAGESVDLEMFLTQHPEHAEELKELLPAMALLVNLSRSGDEAIAGVDGNPLDGTLGDFRLIREVGRGGMGIVYEAEQISLNRNVALKVLPFAATMDPRHLQRFKNEALAAASLRHENIVHVYGVGCERGVHFYAMEFIEGQTLAEVISDCRLRIADSKNPSPGPSPKRRGEEEMQQGVDTVSLPSPPVSGGEGMGVRGDQPTAPVAGLSTKPSLLCKHHYRRIAELIAHAADALEHAHSMGIVHRDVKPGNLLLDSAGKVYVSDFGLARFGDDANMTMSGDLIGTLRYMSPEQALARHGLVDHRTDIYSLGATLYELLTLRPAVAGEDKSEILKSIAWEEPIALRKHDKSIPAELETITLKCLAKNPGDRYASAAEMAEDLRRWLGDQTIKAKPPGWREKAGKWTRRHQTFARMSLVIVVLAVTGLAVSTWLIWKEKEAVRLAKIDVETQRDRAAKARDRTFEALDAMTSGLAGVSLEVQPAISAEQRTFLTNVLGYYQEFAAEQAEDERTRKRIAAAAARVGLIHSRLGARKESFNALEQAQEAYQTLVADFPAVSEYRKDLARNHGSMAFMLVEMSKYSEAEQACLRALTILKQLAAEFPTHHQIQVGLADTYDKLGILFRKLSKLKESETACREGLAIRRNLAAELPLEPSVRSALAHSYNNLGILLQKLGKRQEAENALNQALELQEKLVVEFPNKHEYRSDLAKHHTNLGNHKQALEILDKLVADFPAVPDYRKQLGACHSELGLDLLNSGKATEAANAFRRSMAIFEKLTSDYPAEASYRSSLATKHANLGNALKRLGRAKEAEASNRVAIALQESLVAEFPAVPEYRHALAQSQVNLGTLLCNRGNHSAAEPLFRQALILLEALVAEFPAVPEYRHNLTNGLNNQGLFLCALGKRPEAEAAYRQALAHREKLVADFPTRHEYRENLGASWQNLALLFSDWGRLPDAEAAFREAIALAKKLAADFPAEPTHRQNLAKRHNDLGIMLFKSGMRPQAEQAFRQSLALNEMLTVDFPNVPEHQIDLAGTHVNLGHLLRQECRDVESIEFYNRSIAVLKPLVDANPRLTTARRNLRNAYVGRAETLDRLERFAESIQEWERAIELILQGQQLGLAADFPVVPGYIQSLAKSHAGLGIQLINSGKRTEGATAFRKALAIQEKLATDYPGVPQYLIDMAGGQINLGHLLRESGKADEALELYDRAIISLKPLVGAQSHLANGRQNLLYGHWGRADALDRLERFSDAIPDWNQAINLAPPAEQTRFRLARATSQIRAGLASEAIAGVAELTSNHTLSADQWYDLACVYAVACNKYVDKKQEYADRAMELLRKATKAGYKNGAHMKNDTDLSALRDREDFKKLIAELDLKTKS